MSNDPLISPYDTLEENVVAIATFYHLLAFPVSAELIRGRLQRGGLQSSSAEIVQVLSSSGWELTAAGWLPDRSCCSERVVNLVHGGLD